MKNRITEMLKIKYPIVMGGMAGVTDGTFAAAVSEAGGLGTIGAFKESGQSLATEIRRLKELSVKPFAVNVPLIVPQVADPYGGGSRKPGACGRYSSRRPKDLYQTTASLRHSRNTCGFMRGSGDAR
jgi:NAD(P)H-dependent flavin oxidoreductase YrpB (nitropropane dioxygenase family)